MYAIKSEIKRQFKNVLLFPTRLKDFVKRKKIERKYLSPDVLKPEVDLDSDTRLRLDEFKDNGIVSLSGFEKEANYIIQTYFSDTSSMPKNSEVLSTERSKKTGRTFVAKLSFSDINLQNLFFNKSIIGLVYNYYKRQPFYRNLPYVTKQEFSESNAIDIQGLFHLDGGLKQVSAMLLLNDLSDDDTHMEYALKSINDKVPFNLDRFNWKEDDILSKYEIKKLIGKKGTLFLFDAGNGYHRAVYKNGSVRKILHLNFNCGGYKITECEFNDVKFDHLKEQPEFVKETISLL